MRYVENGKVYKIFGVSPEEVKAKGGVLVACSCSGNLTQVSTGFPGASWIRVEEIEFDPEPQPGSKY